MKKVTMRDIGKAVGVSAVTVSKAMAGESGVSDAVRQKILQTAAEMGYVNPNTVQKAYRMLEEEGLIQSHSGAKSYVVLDSAVKERIRSELLESDTKSVIHSLRQMGLTKEDAVALIEKYWE